VVGVSVVGTCVLAACVVATCVEVARFEVARVEVARTVVVWAEVSMPGTDRAVDFAADWPVVEVVSRPGSLVAFVGGFVTPGFVATGSVCVVSASEIPPTTVVSETVTIPMVFTVVVVRRFGVSTVDPELRLGVFWFGVVFCGRTRTARCFAAELVAEAAFDIVAAGFVTAVAFGVAA
jgi:hypothetical protein